MHNVVTIVTIFIGLILVFSALAIIDRCCYLLDRQHKRNNPEFVCPFHPNLK